MFKGAQADRDWVRNLRPEQLDHIPTSVCVRLYRLVSRSERHPSMAMKDKTRDTRDQGRGLDINQSRHTNCSQILDFSLKLSSVFTSDWQSSRTSRFCSFGSMNCHIASCNKDCLHLTLAIRLDKLSGLKKLQELHIPNMCHHVKEVNEVQWMAQ